MENEKETYSLFQNIKLTADDKLNLEHYKANRISLYRKFQNITDNILTVFDIGYNTNGLISLEARKKETELTIKARMAYFTLLLRWGFSDEKYKHQFNNDLPILAQAIKQYINILEATENNQND